MQFADVEDITNWLTHKDYVEGIRLYLAHGQDDKLKKLLTTEQRTDYKADRLERALKEILRGTEKPAKKEKKIPKVISQKSWSIESAIDDVLRALRAEWLTKFKEMQDLRSQLMLLANDDQRGEAAHRILNLDDECDLIYDKRDYYLQHGKLPTPKPDEDNYVKDPHKQVDRMYTLARYVRRENQNLKNNPANVGAAERKRKFIKEYNYYAKRFGRNNIQEETEAGTPTKE